MPGSIADMKTGLDAPRVGELLALLGLEKLDGLIDILEERLRDFQIRFEHGEEVRHLIKVVHQSQGSAASLGFQQVAVALEQLEQLMAAVPKDPPQGMCNEERPCLGATITLIMQALEKGRSQLARMVCQSV